MPQELLPIISEIVHSTADEAEAATRREPSQREAGGRTRAYERGAVRGCANAAKSKSDTPSPVGPAAQVGRKRGRTIADRCRPELAWAQLRSVSNDRARVASATASKATGNRRTPRLGTNSAAFPMSRAMSEKRGIRRHSRSPRENGTHYPELDLIKGRYMAWAGVARRAIQGAEGAATQAFTPRLVLNSLSAKQSAHAESSHLTLDLDWSKAVGLIPWAEILV